MPAYDDLDRSEYSALMQRGRDAERGAQLGWIAGAMTAAVTMSWAISASSPALMIPVVFAIAAGFYASLRSREQVRRIAGYVEEFCENSGGAQWFTRVHRLQAQPGYRPVGDWLTTCLANAGVVAAVVLSWMYADSSSRADVMAMIVTGCGIAFGFHSISETVRIAQTDWRAMWRQVGGELKEAPRSSRAGGY